MRRHNWALLAALTLPALGACGGPTPIEPGAAETFQQQVRSLATLTQQGNVEQALQDAEALKADVEAAEQAGNVAPGRADRIQAGIDAFVASLDVAPEPAVPEVTEPSVPETTVPATVEADPPVSPPKQITEDDRKDAEEAQKRADDEAKEKAKDEAKDREDDDDDG